MLNNLGMDPNTKTSIEIFNGSTYESEVIHLGVILVNNFCWPNGVLNGNIYLLKYFNF
jgi:hypothetical protein